MNLQDIFYLLAIIFMLSGIILTAFIGFLAWKAYRSVSTIQQAVGEKLMLVAKTNKAEMASIVGLAASKFIMGRVKSIFRR